jgi:hypothetical protein
VRLQNVLNLGNRFLASRLDHHQDTALLDVTLEELPLIGGDAFWGGDGYHRDGRAWHTVGRGNGRGDDGSFNGRTISLVNGADVYPIQVCFHQGIYGRFCLNLIAK